MANSPQSKILDKIRVYLTKCLYRDLNLKALLEQDERKKNKKNSNQVRKEIKTLFETELDNDEGAVNGVINHVSEDVDKLMAGNEADIDTDEVVEDLEALTEFLVQFVQDIRAAIVVVARQAGISEDQIHHEATEKKRKGKGTEDDDECKPISEANKRFLEKVLKDLTKVLSCAVFKSAVKNALRRARNALTVSRKSKGDEDQ